MAGLTQEELAEAAQVSQRAVSDLERGINATARKDTAQLLAGALGLAGSARELFIAAARGRASAEAVLSAAAREVGMGSAAAASRTLPRDVAAFTGRQAELGQLMARWAEAAGDGGVVSVCAIGGMAGIGKTTFAVHAAHRLADRFPDGQFFLPLHAHTPGQRPVDPADALASLLLTAGVPAGQIPPSADARAARWRDQVAGEKVLLVLDDAAGHEQVRSLLPGTPGSLVLITSRRRLAALEDAAVVSLDILSPGEAAGLLARLADRPGLDSGDAVVGEIARLCGYLPLAIGMLASQLRHHPAWTAADLAAGLAAARDRLALMRAENLSVAAALNLSYRELTAAQRRLFRRLGLVPGPSFDAYAAAALDSASLGLARRNLEQLYDQHLLAEPAPGRYVLHDLVREHARALAAADDPAACHAATGQLLDYYLHASLAADRHVATRTTADSHPPPGSPPTCAPQILGPRQAVAWLETERPNLHAAVVYAAARARPLHAIAIPAAIGGFLCAHGYWDQAAILHQTALTVARQTDDQPGQARALILLGMVQRLTGDHWAAAASHQQALALFRDLGDRSGQARALNELGIVQQLTGEFPAAAASHQQSLDLYRDLGDRLGRAFSLNDLGLAQAHTGDYPAAAISQKQALALFHNLGSRPGQAWALSGLGLMQRLTGDYPAAAASHQQALDIFRELGDPPGQADTLNELGIVQQLTGDYPAAASKHQQALALYRDLGNQFGQAEALNSLGELLSRSGGSSDQARDYHTRALIIARDISAPHEEARALEGIGLCDIKLEGIGLCDIKEGHPGDGTAQLRQALRIYQRVGTPAPGVSRKSSVVTASNKLRWASARSGSGGRASAMASR